MYVCMYVCMYVYIYVINSLKSNNIDSIAILTAENAPGLDLIRLSAILFHSFQLNIHSTT